jgi:murein L,D-transpeptidase YcbB/YkuD
MEKTELKRVLMNFWNLLKTELSEREMDLKEKAEMARKILQMEGALKQAVDEPQNERAAEELRTSDAHLLQLKQELAETRAKESAWEESKRELEDELHRVKLRLTEELACKSCNRYRKYGPFKK